MIHNTCIQFIVFAQIHMGKGNIISTLGLLPIGDLNGMKNITKTVNFIKQIAVDGSGFSKL